MLSIRRFLCVSGMWQGLCLSHSVITWISRYRDCVTTLANSQVSWWKCQPKTKMKCRGFLNFYPLWITCTKNAAMLRILSIAARSFPWLSTSQMCSIKGNLPPKFREGCRSSRFWQCPEHNSVDYYLTFINQAQQSLSCHPAHFACLPSYGQTDSGHKGAKATHLDQGQEILDPWCLLKKVSCAKLCVILWQRQNIYAEEACFKQAPPFLFTRFELWKPLTFKSSVPCLQIFAFLFQNQEKIGTFNLILSLKTI
jgi:hypothetical protein